MRELAADGWSIVGIAWKMGVDRKTFEGWLERHPELQDAMDLGRACSENVIYNLLWRKAVEEGNLTAMIYLSKAMFGWRDFGDQSDQGTRVNVTIALPGAMTLQQFTSIGQERTAP